MLVKSIRQVDEDHGSQLFGTGIGGQSGIGQDAVNGRFGQLTAIHAHHHAPQVLATLVEQPPEKIVKKMTIVNLCPRIGPRTEPDNCRIETWRGFSAPKRKKELKLWDEFKEERRKAREQRGFPDAIADKEAYDEKREEAKQKLKLPDAPAMPCISKEQIEENLKKQMETSGPWTCMLSIPQRQHQDRIGDV